MLRKWVWKYLLLCLLLFVIFPVMSQLIIKALSVMWPAVLVMGGLVLMFYFLARRARRS